MAFFAYVDVQVNTKMHAGRISVKPKDGGKFSAEWGVEHWVYLGEANKEQFASDGLSLTPDEFVFSLRLAVDCNHNFRILMASGNAIVGAVEGDGLKLVDLYVKEETLVDFLPATTGKTSVDAELQKPVHAKHSKK